MVHFISHISGTWDIPLMYRRKEKNMKNSYMQRKEDIVRNWYVIDAEGKSLGRVATEAAHSRGRRVPSGPVRSESCRLPRAGGWWRCRWSPWSAACRCPAPRSAAQSKAHSTSCRSTDCSSGGIPACSSAQSPLPNSSVRPGL